MEESDKYRGNLADKFEQFESYPEPHVWSGIEGALSDDGMRGKLYTSFAGVEVLPSEKVWDNVAAALPKKKRRKAAFWWWTGVAASVLVLLSLFLFDGKGQHHLATYQPRIQEGERLSGVAAESELRDENEVPAATETNNSPSSDVLQSQSELADQNEMALETATQLPKKNPVRGPGSWDRRGNDGHRIADQPRSRLESPSSAASSSENNNDQLTYVSVTPLEPMEELASPLLGNVSENHPTTLYGTMVPPFETDVSQDKFLQFGSGAFVDGEPDKVVYTTGPIPTVSTGNGQPNTGSPVSTDESSVVSSYEAYNSLGYLEREPPIIFAATFNFSAGKRWNFEGGFSYRTQTTKGQRSDYNFTSNSIADYRLKVHSSYIGVPLSVRYDFIQGNKWTLYGSQGLLTEFPLTGRFREDVYAGGEHVEQHRFSSKVSRTQLSLVSGIGAAYRLTPHVGVYLQPSVHYIVQHGLNFYHYNNYSRIYPGAQVGLRLHLL